MHTRREFIRSGASAAVAATLLSQTGSARAQSSGKRRIGFVDNSLNNYHSNVFLQALRGPLAARGFTVTGATALKVEESRAWAEKNDVPFFEEDEALNKVVDFYMVLAPSSADTHLELCRRFLPFGKPTYVDKTFASDLATAKKIFGLADQHGTPIQTTSALRYTNVQTEAAQAKVNHMITWGGGGSYNEYAIHPLELMISIMGPQVTSLMRRGTPEQAQLLLNFSDDRTGVVNVFTQTNTPFAASFTTEKATRHVTVDASRIFIDNQAALLDFFETGRPNVDRRESLAIMEILDAARDPRALKSFILLGNS
jgi:predicted dehydrogenase